MSLDLSPLNPQQRAAVLQTEGPLLVLAGAGSGKTRVIAHRVVHLLDRGVPARAILAVTFTNKVAAEMRERIARLAGTGVEGAARSRGLTVSTFHSLGLRVLREQRERLGLPERFAILDAGDQGALVKRLLREVKVDDRRFDVGRVAAILSRLRTSGAEGHPDDEYESIASELRPRYEMGLRAMGAVDFDDLLLLPLRLFEQREVLRVAYEDKVPFREIAALYRTNAQARPLEEALRLSGVRYRVVGGTSLFDRKEVRDLLAYLRAALNPLEEVSLLRIVNVPARGIGDQTVARAQELARARGVTLWEVLRAGAPELAHAAERIAEFVALLERYGRRLGRRGFSEAARELCEAVGLFEEARRGAQSAQAQSRRVEALEGLLRQLAEFERRTELRASTSTEVCEDDADPFAAGLRGYLARLALDSKDPDTDAGDAVTLTTLHAAKGLEWRCVFLCGLEEGLLPHSGRGFDDSSAEPSAEGVANLEEERRFAYVGMTRARERLTLTRAAQRLRRGKLLLRAPSRFLDDLPAELTDLIDLRRPQAESPKQAQQAKAKGFFSDMRALLEDDPAPESEERG